MVSLLTTRFAADRPNTRRWLGSEIRIVLRYTRIVRLLAFVAALSIALVVLDAPAVLEGKIDLMHSFALVNTVLGGSLFVQLFVGGWRTARLYFVAPVAVSDVVRLKSTAVLVVAGGFVLASQATAAVALQASPRAFGEALLYIITALPVLLHGGMRLAAALDIEARAGTFAVLYALLLGGASIPFVLLRVLFGSPVLCLVFAGLVVAAWYGWGVVQVAHQLERRKHEVLGFP